MTSRRSFLKKGTHGLLTATIGSMLPGFSARSYSNILGSNENINLGVIGVNSRGLALATNFAKRKDCKVTCISDVDSRAMDKCAESLSRFIDYEVRKEMDFRKMLDDKTIDVIVVATPDHWHAPAALLAMKAGKDVYLEKPCSYAPAEGEMLVEAAAKYNRVLQMGNQRRSWPNVREAISLLHEGIIGDVPFAKAWYTNNRQPIGVGKETKVPEWLNWDLWQGPAPRMPYKDNYVHYNWHWFWHWGTGEALNNGTHMVDLMRWGMHLDLPVKVDSMGGRYYGNDDWETPDTQIINLEFNGNKSMTWEGRSCNPRTIEGNSVGCMFYGEQGSLLITGRDHYIVYGLDNQVVREQQSRINADSHDRMNPAEKLDSYHFTNFFNAIRKGEALHSDIQSGHTSTLLVQLGNISQRVGHSLKTDSSNGRIIGDPEAMKLWNREYEPGWEMKLD